MVELPPSLAGIHAELDRARSEFHSLVDRATHDDLQRKSEGTEWTNRQLLFHMLFGYLITRNLRVIVKVMSRAPGPAQRGFAGMLDAATRPFHKSTIGAHAPEAPSFHPARADAWLGRVVASLQRHLDRESDKSLRRTMRFPARWDPYFADHMSLADVYHYATQHFEHHRRQLTTSDAAA